MNKPVDPERQRDSMADDLLEGADKIAEFIWGDPEKSRRVYYFRQNSRMPLFKMSGRLCALKSTLRAWIKEQEKRGWQFDR